MPAQFYQGMLIEADTGGVPKLLVVRDADTGATHDFNGGFGTNVVRHSGQTQIAYSFVTPFTGHLVREEPQDAVPWRKFGISWITQPTPEAAMTWATQFTSHGMPGFMHVPRIEAAWESNTDITLSIVAQDGTSPAPVILPASGSAVSRATFSLTFNKARMYQYSATSSAPFRLFLDDWVVWVAAWGSAGQAVPWRGLGGVRGEMAAV